MAPAVSRLDSKPGRSEEDVLDAEEQLRMAEALRLKFADAAPKRPLKPSRSDISAGDAVLPQPDPYDGPIPEHIKLQTLVNGSPSEIFVREYAGNAPDEFVETDYYNDLYAVDKTLHHTTGTGFIQVDSKVADYNSLPDVPIVRSSQVLDIKYIGGNVPDEFVETEYYKDLNAVDKTQHHTTGSGFIQVENNDALSFNISPTGLVRTKSSSNPATNDWIPGPDALDSVASDKPHRSEP